MKHPKHTLYNFALVFGVILLAVVLRLLPHPANVAPIAAMALFGGVYLPKRYALIIPIGAMFLSDIIIGFHPGMPFVYGSFLLTVLIGMWLRNHMQIATVAGATLLSSLMFFFLSNFNFWYTDALYPKTIQGLMQSYSNAIPFFRNTLIGDLFYTTLFFGGYAILLKILPQRTLVKHA